MNHAMRDIAAWVADLGFSPSVRTCSGASNRGMDITDKSDEEWNKAFDLFNRFDQAKGIEDLKATLAAARALPGANGVSAPWATASAAGWRS